LLLVLFGFLYKIQSARSEKNTAQTLRKNAFRKAQKNIALLKKNNQSVLVSDFLSRLYSLMEDYLTHKFGFPATGKTIDELKQGMQDAGVKPQFVEACISLLTEIDSFRFGMTAFDNAAKSALLQKSESVIHGLDSLKKGK
jgi:hypothetical protein